MPRANKSTFLVLGLLNEHPKSGYDIKTEVEEVIGHFWKESFGQIYPVLGRLVRQGLVKKATMPTGGRRRHVYSITAKGRTELERWLRVPPEPESVRNELLLKIFFGYELPPEILVGHVEVFRDRLTRLDRFFQQAEREIAAGDFPARARRSWNLTLRLGILVTKARLAWAEEALETLAR